MNPKVSVLTTTYNHEVYIAQAVESVLAQETNFPIEMVVGEDCSTDRTREILLDLKARYPDVLHLKLREQNWGRRRNFLDVFHSCRGQYIAILEGDDYWVSPHKLQKQVDFLDAHPEYSLCFHPVYQVVERDGQVLETRVQAPPVVKQHYTLDDIAERHLVSTCSMLFQNGLVKTFPAWIDTVPAADWPLSLLLAQRGYLGYLPEVMAAYRIHGRGAWTSLTTVEKLEKNLKLRQTMRDFFAPEHQEAFARGIVRTQGKLVRALFKARRPIPAIRYALALIFKPQVPYSILASVVGDIFR